MMAGRLRGGARVVLRGGQPGVVMVGSEAWKKYKMTGNLRALVLGRPSLGSLLACHPCPFNIASVV